MSESTITITTTRFAALMEENERLRARVECQRLELDSMEELVEPTEIDNVELREKIRALREENRELAKDKERLDWLELRFPFLAEKTRLAPRYYTVTSKDTLRLRTAIDNKRSPCSKMKP